MKESSMFDIQGVLILMIRTKTNGCVYHPRCWDVTKSCYTCVQLPESGEEMTEQAKAMLPSLNLTGWVPGNPHCRKGPTPEVILACTHAP